MVIIAKFNLGKSSDLNKFIRSVENDVKGIARKEVIRRNYDIECPHCHKRINVPVGKSACPECGEEIDLKLNINF